MAIYTSNPGNDTLNGGATDDTYQYNLGTGNDLITDTGGIDTLLVDDTNNLWAGKWNISRSGGTDMLIDFNGVGSVTVQGQFAAGTPIMDALTGSDGWGPFNFINGLAGSGANEIIVGYAADDSIAGEGGDDVIFGNQGIDTILGGDGVDEIWGGTGNDSIDGGAGDDDLIGEEGNNTIIGGAGQDGVIYTWSSQGIVANFSGALQGGLANEQVLHSGGTATDTTSGIEKVEGSKGNDVFYGGRTSGADGPNSPGYVNFIGNQGNDTFHIGAGGAGAWSHVSHWDATSGVVVNLGTSSIVVNSQTVASMTGLDGLGGTDTFNIQGNQFGISGSDQADYIRGWDGGTGWINGGAGADTIVGGSGIDSVGYNEDDIADGATFGAIVNLSVGSVTVTGGVTGDGGANVIVAAGTARDNYGDVDTLQNVENVSAGNYSDYLVGSAAANSLWGGGGNDTLIGGAGNDNLNGGDGRDFLRGGSGDDYINGGIILDRINYSDSNTVSYSDATEFVTVNLSGITGDGTTGYGTASGSGVGTDTLSNIFYVQGSNFNDVITGSTALSIEVFEGGLGNDAIDGGAIADFRNARDSNRVSYQNAGGAVNVNLLNGTASGANGNDTLLNINQVRGSNFGDTLTGSANALVTESFEGRGGDDAIDGGGGTDFVRYDTATGAVIVNLASGTATGADGSDTLLNIEGVRGSAYDDTLTGGLVANDVFEFFMGMGGNDTINGGSGYDRADYQLATAGVSVVLGGTANGSAMGDASTGTDTLISIEGVRGSEFNDNLTGSNDAGIYEVFEGRVGNDSINGGGGVDRVDYWGADGSVTVNLATGTASDGFGGTDTLVNVEDIRGSRDFGDTLVGNSASNKFLGMGGNDTIDGGAGTDTAVFSGAKAGYSVVKSGANWVVTDTNLGDGNDGADTLSNIEFLQFSDSSRKLGSVASDFNGDGKSDLVWRSASTGADAIWLSGNSATKQSVATIADPNWKIAGAGDFNGDSKSDLLWRNGSTGDDSIWLSGNNATKQSITAIADTNWKIAGLGDFNGDGKDDILWRNTSTGGDTIFLSGNSATKQSVATVADQNWKVAGIGDFDGDSKSDILWRNTATGSNSIWKSGNSATTQGVASVTDQNWKVGGVGDFNGDGKDDILWRNAANGSDSIWLGGNSATKQSVATVADQNWKVSGTGDYNGDGKDDILWRNVSTGADSIWLSANNATTQAVATVTGTDWQLPEQANTWLTDSGSYPV